MRLSIAHDEILNSLSILLLIVKWYANA